MKRFLKILTLCLCCAFCVVNFTGCSNNKDDNDDDKTIYTQTRPVIFIYKTDYGTVSSVNCSIVYFDTAKSIIRSSNTIDKANEIYRQIYETYNYDMQQYNEYGGIKASSIDIIHGGETVFIMSYKDYDENVASKNLDAFIQAANITLQECYSNSGTAELIPITTEHYCSI